MQGIVKIQSEQCHCWTFSHRSNANHIEWFEVGITGHNFGRGPSKDHSTKVWLQLAQYFLRRRLKCEMLTDGRKVMAIAHMTLWVR